MTWWLSALVVLVLILVEAVFAASEMALVTLREGQVSDLASRGHRGERIAALASNPNRFLSAVQIGVTTTALLSSAFGALTLSDSLTDRLRDAGVGHDLSSVIGFLVVTLAIAYVTLVVGELAPKRIALQRAAGTASAVAPTLDRFAALMTPVIWLLSVSTDLVVRLLGGDPTVNREVISEGELRDLVTGHEALSREEQQLIDDVFEAGDRQVREIMVPRTEVEFFDAGWSLAKATRTAHDSPHSRFPVVRGSQDDVVGFIHVRDLFRPPTGQRRGVKVADLVREVPMIPSTKRVLAAMSEMRRCGDHLAVVVDEYGGTAGIVTLEDLIEELVGDIRDEYDADEDEARKLRGGDFEVDGLINLDDFEEATGSALPDGPYETVAGAVVATLGRLPKVGDAVELDGVRLKVTKLDGRRAARVRVTVVKSDADDAS
ncbi:MAG TPA: hemolysin family protein [Mycobacteriales bacterium]|nr:hemolysin family protein [Mycobacteriales bacterium]